AVEGRDGLDVPAALVARGGRRDGARRDPPEPRHARALDRGEPSHGVARRAARGARPPVGRARAARRLARAPAPPPRRAHDRQARRVRRAGGRAAPRGADVRRHGGARAPARHDRPGRGRGRRRGPGGRPQDGPPHRDEGGGRRAPAARRLPARGRGGCARRARGHAQRGRPARVRGQHARGPGRRAAARARPRPRRVELGPRARRGGRRDDVGGHVHGTPERAVRDVPRAPRVPGAARGQEGGRVSSELFELPEPAGPAVRLVAADGVALEPVEHGPATPEPVRHSLSATRIAYLLGRPRPTPEEVEVIEARLEPTLVVAGAGSGKTETMAARVVWLIANGLVAPDAVLGLTFTRKAAGELAERVQVRLAQLARARGGAASALSLLDRPTVATYNAYAASLVGDHGLR